MIKASQSFAMRAGPCCRNRCALQKTQRFQEELLQLRDTAREDPVPTSLLKALREVSSADVAEHPPWAFATIAVLSNYDGTT